MRAGSERRRTRLRCTSARAPRDRTLPPASRSSPGCRCKTANIAPDRRRRLQGTSRRHKDLHIRIRGRPGRGDTARPDGSSVRSSWCHRTSIQLGSRRWCSPQASIDTSRCPARARTRIRPDIRSRREGCTREHKCSRDILRSRGKDPRRRRYSRCLWSSHTSLERRGIPLDQRRHSRKACPTMDSHTRRTRPCRRPRMRHRHRRPSRQLLRAEKSLRRSAPVPDTRAEVRPGSSAGSASPSSGRTCRDSRPAVAAAQARVGLAQARCSSPTTDETWRRIVRRPCRLLALHSRPTCVPVSFAPVEYASSLSPEPARAPTHGRAAVGSERRSRSGSSRSASRSTTRTSRSPTSASSSIHRVVGSAPRGRPRLTAM